MPKNPRISTANLTPRANQMFCFTIRRVFREIRMAVTIFAGLSSMRTTSAASMAASDPRAPMAMPTSARVSTGASLMPSPTKASTAPGVLASNSRSTWATLSAGSSWAWYSSSPRSPATDLAVASVSPVSITVRFTPAAFKPSDRVLASGFGRSEMRMWPA